MNFKQLIWAFLPVLFFASCDTAPPTASSTPLQDTTTIDTRTANSGYPDARPDGPPPAGMVWIPGGEFTMGTDDTTAYFEERPAHRVKVHGYWMDTTEVTNRAFEAFVKATGYKTDAERVPTAKELLVNLPPGTPPPDPSTLEAGSLVFEAADHPIDLRDWTQWWRWVVGADWRHPEGPKSSIADRMDNPVVQVSWNDVQAYCAWAKKRLPTEAEWERAARGGLEKKKFPWGDDEPTDQYPRCNSWQGHFPYENTAKDGYVSTAPVASYPPNGYGLYDMAGNVWEWCQDWIDVTSYGQCGKNTVQHDPQGPSKSYDPQHPYEKRRAQRGGSFLCADNYCGRYRPSARQGSTEDTGMDHAGFRCVMDADPVH